MYFMVRSLLSNQSTISDHVGRGKRWGVARKASLSFEMGLLCIYAGTTTETAAPRGGIKFVGIGIAYECNNQAIL